MNILGYRLLATTYQMKAINFCILSREVNDISVPQPRGHHTKLVVHTRPIEWK